MRIEKKVIHEVCRVMQLEVKTVMSASRMRELVNARGLCYVQLKKHLGYTNRYIGQLVGGRASSTIWYAIETLNNVMQKDEALRARALEVDHAIRSLVGEHYGASNNPPVGGIRRRLWALRKACSIYKDTVTWT